MHGIFVWASWIQSVNLIRQFGPLNWSETKDKQMEWVEGFNFCFWSQKVRELRCFNQIIVKSIPTESAFIISFLSVLCEFTEQKKSIQCFLCSVQHHLSCLLSCLADSSTTHYSVVKGQVACWSWPLQRIACQVSTLLAFVLADQKHQNWFAFCECAVQFYRWTKEQHAVLSLLKSSIISPSFLLSSLTDCNSFFCCEKSC